MTTVLKLGGSVITDKSRPETIDRGNLDRAADDIAAAESAELVLVHGGGSFGHPAAAEHGLSRTDGTRDLAAIAAVTDAMRRLNDRVLTALHDRSIPAIRIQAMAMAARGGEGEVTCADVGIRRLCTEGFLPVLHGDLIGHAGQGCSIVSGDELAVAVGQRLDADRIGFCTAVPGVLDEAGDVIDRIDATTAGAVDLTGMAGTDVTGGMATKVETVAGCGIPAAVFGLDALPSFLAGQMPGTTVR